jgi:Spy/CpxP family protein refolding chaperone
MRKFLAFTVAAVVALGAASVFAGEGCCGSMSKSSAKGACCGDMFSKLNLTPKQKVQMTALTDECRKAMSTSEYHVMFNAGLQRILTPDQLAQWVAHSGKAKASGECPYMKSMGAKSDKQT